MKITKKLIAQILVLVLLIQTISASGISLPIQEILESTDTLSTNFDPEALDEMPEGYEALEPPTDYYTYDESISDAQKQEYVYLPEQENATSQNSESEKDKSSKEHSFLSTAIS